MGNIYYGYLTESERQDLIEETRLENQWNKLMSMYEMCLIKEKQMYADAELKVLTEGGTYDDLTYLFQEADAANAEQKKGILESIFSAIGAFFKKIFDGIKNLFSGSDKNPDEMVEVDEDFDEKQGAIATSMNKLKEATSAAKSKNIAGAITAALAAVGGLGVLVKCMYDAEQLKWSNDDNEYIAPLVETTISKCNLSVANSYDTFEQIKS